MYIRGMAGTETRGRKKAQRLKVTRTFAAFPEEIEAWRVKAKAVDRSLSEWIRLRLLAADARDEELAQGHNSGKTATAGETEAL
jgi:hypothetical protein